jgi:ribosomal protein L25 (general stress protein Ctc)
LKVSEGKYDTQIKKVYGNLAVFQCIAFNENNPTNKQRKKMKSHIITLTVLLLTQSVFSQTKTNAGKKEVQKVLNTFMECLVKKDSIKFYNLFYTEPVVWIGVTQQRSFADELKKDSTAKDNFRANYKSFYRHFYTKEIEEKFYNIQILEDGYIASVIFDYSFLEKGIKTNWGKEIWAMIKTKGQWKITSVIFSTEDENINPEPKSKKARKIGE